MQWTYILEEPWMLAVGVGIGAFLLGVLIPKKSGANWLSAVVLFPLNLFLDVLDMVHTKKFKYYGLILALLCIEAFFAARASVVYYDVLGPHMSSVEIALVCVLVFVSVGLCGYMVATHGKPTVWSVITAIFVIAHDWSGTVYMNYSPVASNVTTNNQLTVLITIGMCGMSILPFIMGRWVEQLYPELEKEMEEEVDKFTSTATRKIKRRAVDRVLRLANHTNVVHLVRALPAEEFLDFKAFVMPIIAPGTPLNLTDQEPSKIAQNDVQDDSQVAGKMNEEKQSKTTQDDSQKSGKMTDQTMSKNQSNDSSASTQNDSQNGTQKPASRTTRKLSNETQTDASKKPSKNELRDARIRHFASTHDMTHAQLSRRFKVSVSTVARALAEGKPSTNGHSTERNTDEMEALVVTEGELVATMN